MERANVGKQYSRAFPGGPPGVDQRYENYRAPYRAEYSPSRNPHHPSHANRTEHRDPRYSGYFERNMRGKDRYNIDVGPRPERDTTGVGGLINKLDTGNIGYTDMLNSLFGSPGSRFNEEYSDWEDKFGDDYMISGQPFISQDNISSERQPGLEEGIMGALPGEYETAGIYQQWKTIASKFGEAYANSWLAQQQAV